MTDTLSLAAGRPYLAIPGPSVVPDQVLRAMHHHSSNIYAGELVDMLPGILSDLKRVARTTQNAAIYISNGHGLWEASLVNVTAPGDQVLVITNGRFGGGWGETARKLGLAVTEIDSGMSKPLDLDRLRDALKADTAHAIKVLMAVHVDTSGSICNDISALRSLLDDLGHPALLAVDCIASMGCDRFEMDAWGVDIAVTGSQKGLMMTPGLAFMFFSDKAAARRAELEQVSPYWDWSTRCAPDVFYQYFCGTPPVQQLYGLRAALDLIHDGGIEVVWKRHEILAQAVWAAVEAWGQGSGVALEVQDKALRSHAVTSVALGVPEATRLRTWCEDNLGLTLGLGLRAVPFDDPQWQSYFRMGHMGHVNGQMILGLLGGVQTGLVACDIPHGTGAIEAAAQVLAQVGQ